jgi:mannose-6-phosphate isomerase-like protein (cupin superfamily)
MTIIRAAEAPRFALDGAEFTVFSGPSNGSQQICTWRLTIPAGKESMPHTLDRDEVFMVLSGRLRLGAGGAELGPGDSAVVPAGQPIAATNPGDEPAEVYVAIQAGFTAYTAEGEVFGTPPWAS